MISSSRHVRVFGPGAIGAVLFNTSLDPPTFLLASLSLARKFHGFGFCLLFVLLPRFLPFFLCIFFLLFFLVLSNTTSSQGRFEDFDFGGAGAWISDCSAETFSTSPLASIFVFLLQPLKMKQASDKFIFISRTKTPLASFISKRQSIKTAQVAQARGSVTVRAETCPTVPLASIVVFLIFFKDL